MEVFAAVQRGFFSSATCALDLAGINFNFLGSFRIHYKICGSLFAHLVDGFRSLDNVDGSLWL